MACLVLAVDKAIERTAANGESVQKNAIHHGYLIYLLRCRQRIASSATRRDAKCKQSSSAAAHLHWKDLLAGMKNE